MLRSAMLWAVVLLVSCGAACAAGVNTKDPIIIIAGDDDVSRANSSSFPLGSVFSILSPTGTSPLSLLGGSPCEVLGIELPLCLFSNGTDFTWTTLTFSITPKPILGLVYTCLALAYFSDCNFSEDHQNVTFSGGSGLPAGGAFLFAVVLWSPNSTFAGEAAGSQAGSGTSWRSSLPGAPVSQPSTAAIFLDGHVAIRDHCRLRLAATSPA